MTPIHVSVKDFSESPSGRTREDGPHSGEEFRESVLVPALMQAENEGTKLIVDMNGTMGLASNWMQEAFYKLDAKRGPSCRPRPIVEIRCDDPSIVKEANQYLLARSDMRYFLVQAIDNLQCARGAIRWLDESKVKQINNLIEKIGKLKWD